MRSHISLFSGIGGFDLAAERAGFKTVLCAEQDAHCQTVLRTHWPDVPVIDDVRGVDDSISADIISGGFPCQDISVAGRRAGLDGERSGLWWEYRRILAAVRPTWTVIENVPGLLSSNGGRDMGAILGALGELGYGFAYRVLDAQFFGVAQRRRRVFIVGCLGSGRRAAEILFEPEGLCGNPAPSREARKATARTFATSPDGSGKEVMTSPTVDARAKDGPRRNQGEVIIAGAGNDTVGTLAPGAHPGGFNGQDVGQLVTVVKTDNTQSNGWGVLEDGTTHTLGGATDAVVCVRMREGCAGGGKGPLLSEDKSLTLATNNDQFVVAAFSAGQGSEAGSIGYRDEQAPTLKSSASGTNMVPTIFQQNQRNEVREMDIAGALPAQPGMKQQNYLAGQATVRRLTCLECERLQGFPDGWTAGHADSQRYKMLGNAVAVPVVEWIMRRIGGNL